MTIKEEIKKLGMRYQFSKSYEEEDLITDQILDLILSKCCVNCRIMLESDNDKLIKQDK